MYYPKVTTTDTNGDCITGGSTLQSDFKVQKIKVTKNTKPSISSISVVTSTIYPTTLMYKCNVGGITDSDNTNNGDLNKFELKHVQSGMTKGNGHCV